MISEVDLRDWNKVNWDLITTAKSEVDEYFNFEGAYHMLNTLVNQVLEIRERQLYKIPKLERKSHV